MTGDLPTYAPHELRGILSDLGHSDAVIEAQLRAVERQGRLTGPLVDPSAPRTLSLDAIYSPPAEQFLLGRLAPLAKSTVLFGPTGAGKSAVLGQLVFAIASRAPSLWGLAVGVHGPVLVVSAEDSHEDWQRRASAIHYGTDADVERALADVHVLDLTEGEARLSEVVTVHALDGTRRQSRATELAERIVAFAHKVGAVLVVIETASRLVEDEDNASFAALQSALGRIARATGAAVVVSHHATKAASRENDSSIESARGGGALIANARNAIALYPADAKVAGQLAERFPPEDVFELHHGKSTSSTRREDALVLVRVGTPSGAVFMLPQDVEASPEIIAAAKARHEKARALEREELRRLFQFCEDVLPTRSTLSLSRSFLVDECHAELKLSRRRTAALVERAVQLGILREGKRTERGVALVLGTDPRDPIRNTITPPEMASAA